MPSPSFDYIVVGAGSAGCILAARLAADGETRVLLLEAGRKDNHWTIRVPGGLRAHYKLDSPFNWHFTTLPQAHLDGRELYQPRGKTVGGSSSINGMVFLRGNPLDYQRWVQQGAAGWSYAEVLPYFKRLENFAPGSDGFRGGHGPVAVCRQTALDPLSAAFLEAGRQAGFPTTDDVNGAQQEGFGRFDMNVDCGVRASTGRAYRSDLSVDTRLTVVTGALGHRVLIEKDRALGVEYEQAGVVHRAMADREVIVSAGAYGSPQLLMLSGIGPADHLRDLGITPVIDLAGVGENLHDHLEIHLQHRCKQPVSLNGYLKPHRMALVGLEWFLFKRGIAARNQANVGAFLRSNDDLAQPNIQFHFFAAHFNGWNINPNLHGYRLGSGTMRPTSRGHVRLRSADPRQPLDIDPNYLATEEDRQEMRAAFALARQTLAQKAFAGFDDGECDPGPEVRSKQAVDTYIRHRSGSAYHPCGTCKMGAAHDPSAVVDPQGRVRGVARLRVVDASIFPSIVSSNLNAPVMMAAEKLADVIGRKPALDPIFT